MPVGRRRRDRRRTPTTPTASAPVSTSPTPAAYGWNAFGQLCWSDQHGDGCVQLGPVRIDHLRLRRQWPARSATTGATNKAFTWDTVTGGTLPLDIDDGTNAYIYGPLLFGGTAPVEQIPLSGSQAPSYLASTPSGVQTVFGNSTQTSPTSSADKFTFGGGTTGTISAVGSCSHLGYRADHAFGQPGHVGDALVLASMVGSASVTISSVSGGGATWQKPTSAVDTPDGVEDELWLGTTTTTGASTITVTYSSSVSSDLIELNAQEYTASTGTSTTWSKDVVSSRANTSSSTVTFPSLTPTGSAEALTPATPRWPTRQARDPPVVSPTT